MANPRGATLEQKMMGNRPTFGAHADSKQRKLALIQGLNWHAFYFDGKKDFPVFEKFVKSLPGFSAETLKLIHAAPTTRLNPSIISLIKMINDGWIASAQELEKIKNHALELAEYSRTENIQMIPEKTEEIIERVEPKFRPAVSDPFDTR